MNIKIHYRITQDRAGIPQDFTGARRIEANTEDGAKTLAKAQLAIDYQIPESAIEIVRIES